MDKMENPIRIPQRVADLPFSAIRQMVTYANEMESKGQRVVHLEIGRPDFDTPEHIKQAAKDALDQGHVHYTPNYGILPLREAIAAKLQAEQGIAYDPQREIIATVGAAEAISMTLAALFNSGDGLLVPTPAFLSYLNLPKMLELDVQEIPLTEQNSFVLDPEDLERRIKPNSKALILVSPHNPTGSMIPETTLEAVADICKRHNLLVIADEVYEKLVYDGHTFKSIAACPGMQERTILINGFSKTYSMTGWRLGYLCGPRYLVEQILKVHQNLVTSTCSFVQHAGLAALQAPQTCVQEMVVEFQQRRDFMVSSLAEINLPCAMPPGAFYVFPNITHFTADSHTFVMSLLRESGVVTVPGVAFGQAGEGYIRISYANSLTNLKIAVELMAEALKKMTFN